MYYLNNFGGCYTLVYAFVDKKEENVLIGRIRYDLSISSELTSVYEFISFETEKFKKEIHIHNPLFITIQRNVIQYLKKSNSIISYINKIERYGIYYIVYTIHANQMNRIMIGRRNENEEFIIINRFSS